MRRMPGNSKSLLAPKRLRPISHSQFLKDTLIYGFYFTSLVPSFPGTCLSQPIYRDGEP